MSTPQNALAGFDNDRVYLAYTITTSKTGAVNWQPRGYCILSASQFLLFNLLQFFRGKAFNGPEAEGPCLMLELASEPTSLHQPTL